LAIEKLTVPDLGDSNEVEVIELLVSVGQSVEENDSLLVLESDKAAMEIPAPMAGVVISIAVNLGDQVTSGSEMLSLEIAGEAAEPERKDDKVAEKPKATEEAEAAEEITDSPGKSSAPHSSGTGGAVSSLIEVPDLGADDEVEVIEISVAVGDSVAVDDTLLTLESDKAAMDVPAPVAGVIEELLIAIGDKIKTGSPIARISTAESAKASSVSSPESKPISDESTQQDPPPAAPKADSNSASPAPPAKPAKPLLAAPAPSGGKVYAGPAVRKLARELGVDLVLVTGTGAKSRIIKDDVHKYVKVKINAPASVNSGAGISAIPDIDFSQFGEVEEVPRSKLHKLTASNMHRNWLAVPHVAQFNEADITDLEAFRTDLKAEAEKKGVKMTLLPFLLKACAKVLEEYPQFNVSLHSSGEYLIQKKYINIGVAVATEAGLLVPVIKNVDKKSLWELAAEVIELSDKAKKRKLTLEEMQGGCFSISSLGAIGGTGFIPIVSPPEVAILGVSKTQIKPVYMEGEFQPRKMLPITLAYDHKAVNGVDGGLFATYLAKLLGDIRHMI
jgi:pyruvate dehydrogenase E2 component (dihydrolipoamide acetyltransferase)|tara:strand:- start:1553 stop:3232 length:1680 start_codon:yes stop_codon:yes gene_type:complete